MAEPRQETLEGLVTRTRVEQGLPPKITDPEVLAMVAAGVIDHRTAQLRRLRRKAAA